MKLLCLSLSLLCWKAAMCDILRPKGVSMSMLSLYDPSKPFKCLDGSGTFDFEFVNDDYCDCKDGSDEPGTSACSNGHFYCENKGHKPEIIPSSRVGDGICDCCDGSDEWSSPIQCEDTCFEKGRAAREEAERKRQLMSQGYKLREDYMKQGQAAKESKRSRLTALEPEKNEALKIKNDMEELKKSAEELEKAAKDKHEAEWEEMKKKLQAAKDEQDAENAFIELDTDSDNRVSLDELQAHSEFDADSNGEVSRDEAMQYVEVDDPVDIKYFAETVWPKIKTIFQFAASSTEAPPPTTPQSVEAPPTEDSDDVGEGPDDEEYGDGDDDEEEDRDGPEEPENGKTEEETKEPEMPDYDEETKKLMEAADKARADFNEAESTFNRLDGEFNDINKFLETDLGPNESFYPLKGQCFEFTDREYTYRICPYDKAVQKPKNGGSETHLGSWGRFDGPNDNKYSVMKFDHGTKCWNGPDRSATVFIHCGMENALTSASEPNRCEYQFDLTTPAVCDQPTESFDPHDEL